MNKQGKKIEASASTLIDLKVELQRKEEEFKRRKAQQLAERPDVIATKSTLFAKTKKVEVEKKIEIIETTQENDAENEKIKTALEAKAKIYDKMSRGDGPPSRGGGGGGDGGHHDNGEDDDESYLVDFEKKHFERIYNEKANDDDTRRRRERDLERAEREEREDREERDQHRTRERQRSPPKRRDRSDDEGDAPEDGEWVTYVDRVGRTRRCLKDDIDYYAERDKKGLDRDKRDEAADDDDEYFTVDEPDRPVHYQDIRHNEVRDHGIGYFQFSKDEEKRQDQMNLLNKLRDQTAQAQTQREKIKEKRKQALQTRLQKVKQRKLEKMGLTEDDLESEEEQAAEAPPAAAAAAAAAAASNAVEVEVTVPVKKMNEASTNPSENVRLWDQPKMSWYAHKMDSLRNERPDEFSPPDSLYNDDHASTGRSWGRGHDRGEGRGRGEGRSQSRPANEFAPPSMYYDHT